MADDAGWVPVRSGIFSDPRVRGEVMSHFYIGQEEEFVPGSCYYQLTGERDDVWRQLARPADYLARSWLYRTFGRHVRAVMARPDWVFDNEPPRDAPDMTARLVDGLLCGQVIWDRFRAVYPPVLEEAEDLRYLVRTVDDLVEVLYQRPAGEVSAYCVSQAVWQPPEGWRDDGMAY